MWARQWTLQEAASDAGSAGGGAPAGTAEGGAAPGAGAPAAAAPASALAAGASAQPAAAGGAADWLPGKFQVKDGDALNLEASAKKLAESYTALERRLGTGEVPPKSAEEYKVEKLPEGAPAWEEFKTAPENASFLKAAHAKGMTNAQLEFVLGEYFARAPALVEGAAALDKEAVTAKLREVWAEQPAFDANMRSAYTAAQAASKASGVPFHEIEAAIGNNPVALRVLAALGRDLGESRGAPAGLAPGSGAQSVETLMASEAYWNERHPEHKRVSEQVRAHYQSKYSGQAR